MKPVIGIITYGTASPHGNDVSCLNTAYSDAIIKNGGIPLVIPYTESTSAKAPDGIIEAVEHENGLRFAVQWHPEELIESCPEMNRLFKYFIALCAERKT